MLSLLSCSAPPIDDWDPFDPPQSPSVLSRSRRGSRTFSLIRTPSKRKSRKMSISPPENFRHDFHLDKDIVSSDNMDLWNAHWLEELRAQSMVSTPSTKSTTQSAVEPSTTAPSTTTRREKRSSITPQKRKPVPSVIPEMPIYALSPSDVPLPTSHTDASPPSSPVSAVPLVPLLDNAGDTPYVTQTVKSRWDTAIGEIADALRESDYPS